MQAKLIESGAERHVPAKGPPIRRDTPIRYLKGVGPERSLLLAKLGVTTLGDLFYFFPRRYENRYPLKKIAELGFADKECVEARVMSRGVIRTRTGQTIFRLVLGDVGPGAPSGGRCLFGVWFNQPYLAKVFLPRMRVALYGKADREGVRARMIHPEYEILPEGGSGQTVHTNRIVPVYPMTEDLNQKGLRQLIYRLLEEHSELLEDPLPDRLRLKNGLIPFVDAFRQIHFPSSESSRASAYRRLVFDEFFLMQVLIQKRKRQFQKENRALAHRAGEDRVKDLIASFGFVLTQGQTKAIEDIVEDMKRPRAMNRLVQGDVGSGKTAVASAALVFSASNGFQAALMAPTEVLAQQHFYRLSQKLEPLGITCGYLSQAVRQTERNEVLEGLREGRIAVCVGTHALIQEEVRFKNLGLAVIDEQHKFGVFQRAALSKKTQTAKPPHLLLLTATPIPRTLAMTLYGELDISVIDQLPQGRKPVKTLWVGRAMRKQVYAFLDVELEKGRQAYVICPWIDRQDDPSLRTVVGAYEEIKNIFGHRTVALLHGRMSSQEKKTIMKDFEQRKAQVLVSTVVIEVGVDVPNASVLIVENADKFGLSQLHQLRGRIGRGSDEAYCILFSDVSAEETVERLETFVGTRDGFEIAEKDLKLRGAGDLVGERQHGLARLRIGDLVADHAILESATQAAVSLIEADPSLERADHQKIRQALKESYGDFARASSSAQA